MTSLKHTLRVIQGQKDVTANPDNISQECITSQTGDRREFVDYLFERYRVSLLKYLTKFMSSREDAEDVVQEAYIRIMQVETLNNIEAQARSYLFTIATNLARDRARKQKVQFQHAHVSLDGKDLPYDAPSPDKLAEWQEGLQAVKQCLLELSPRCQQVTIMHFIEGLSYSEIAKILRISKKTVVRDIALVLQLCQLRLVE